MREIFGSLRIELEKVFNQEEVQGRRGVIPQQLEDDFQELLSYVRDKVQEIKSEKHISFISPLADADTAEEPHLDHILQELMQQDAKQAKYDALEMAYTSLRNVFRNICEFWLQDEDNEEDFRDNLMLYVRLVNPAEQEKRLLLEYVQKYRELKQITDD